MPDVPLWPGWTVDAWRRREATHDNLPACSWFTFLRTKHADGKVTQVGIELHDIDLERNSGMPSLLNLITCKIDAARLALVDAMKAEDAA